MSLFSSYVWLLLVAYSLPLVTSVYFLSLLITSRCLLVPRFSMKDWFFTFEFLIAFSEVGYPVLSRYIRDIHPVIAIVVEYRTLLVWKMFLSLREYENQQNDQFKKNALVASVEWNINSKVNTICVKVIRFKNKIVKSFRDFNPWASVSALPWTLLPLLQALSIVHNSKNVRRPNTCYFDNWHQTLNLKYEPTSFFLSKT